MDSLYETTKEPKLQPLLEKYDETESLRFNSRETTSRKRTSDLSKRLDDPGSKNYDLKV